MIDDESFARSENNWCLLYVTNHHLFELGDQLAACVVQELEGGRDLESVLILQATDVGPES
jgi:hypothetical protein